MHQKSIYRSSRPEVFRKKGILKIFTKFTRKHLRQSLFLNKMFSCEFCEIFKNILWVHLHLYSDNFQNVLLTFLCLSLCRNIIPERLCKISNNFDVIAFFGRIELRIEVTGKIWCMMQHDAFMVTRIIKVYTNKQLIILSSSYNGVWARGTERSYYI